VTNYHNIATEFISSQQWVTRSAPKGTLSHDADKCKKTQKRRRYQGNQKERGHTKIRKSKRE
jgi:hypothetical protein